MTTAAQAIEQMQALLDAAQADNRVFSEDEASRFAELKLITLEGTSMTTEAPLAPTAPLRPVGGATRSLSGAVRADGLVARMVQSGRARVDIPIDVRALGSTQALNPDPGLALQPANLGLVSTYHGIVNRLLFALGSIPISGTNAVTYTRISYAPAGSPGGLGNQARKVQELDLKPESSLDSESVTEPLGTYAHWLPCSKQVLDDVTGLRALLDTTLINGLLDRTDAALYTSMTAALMFTSFVPTGGDKIADSVARIATMLLVAGATGVKVAMNPMTMLSMGTTKASGSGIYLGLPPNIPATLVASASVAEGKLLAWADTGAVWANREGVSVVAGLNNDDFTRNKVTLLAEHRGSLLTLNAQHVLFGNATA